MFTETWSDAFGATTEHAHGYLVIEGDYVELQQRSPTYYSPTLEGTAHSITQLATEIWDIDYVNRRALKVTPAVTRPAFASCFSPQVPHGVAVVLAGRNGGSITCGYDGDTVTEITVVDPIARRSMVIDQITDTSPAIYLSGPVDMRKQMSEFKFELGTLDEVPFPF